MMNQDDFFSKTLVTGDKKGSNSGEPDRKGGALQGYTMKYYEEELIKLRNDNFSLKLRIHLLEERQGLVVRPEDKNKENVFRFASFSSLNTVVEAQICHLAASWTGAGRKGFAKFSIFIYC